MANWDHTGFVSIPRLPNHSFPLHVSQPGTLSDTAGEAYDKVARLLSLGTIPSGGACLEALAKTGDPKRFRFRVPMAQRPNSDFSYAGLKTALRLAIEAEAPGPATEANLQVSDGTSELELIFGIGLEEGGA